MTHAKAEQQIEAIKKITAEALKTKESAKKILIDAGIIEDKKLQLNSDKKKK